MPRRLFESTLLFKHLRDEIFNDGYIFGVVHGPPRSSKSTIGLWSSYAVYEDWNKVLSATVFNLSSVIQRMKDGKPERWPTSNGLHSRVPLLLWDDFAVGGGNKAESQHSLAWDIFKGSFDCLGTSLGVLLCTMVDAGEATQQLQGKYNIEVFVNSKGKYKYDKVIWKQDFNGFRTIIKKDCQEYGTFDPIPIEIYKKYDEMRMDLNKQAFVRLEDAMTIDTVDMTLKLLNPSDVTLLRLIVKLGPIKHATAKKFLGENYEDTLTKCKARALIIPTLMGKNYYKLEISSVGKSILDAIDHGKGNADLRNITLSKGKVNDDE